MHGFLLRILVIIVLIPSAVAPACAGVFYIIPAEENRFRSAPGTDSAHFSREVHEKSINALREAAAPFHESVRLTLGTASPPPRLVPLWIVPAMLIVTRDAASIERLLPPDMNLVPGIAVLPELPV